MILLCHRFDNKGRRRKRGNLQRKKKQKQKNLNPKQPTATNQQNSMKNKNKQKKNLNPKQPTTTNQQNSMKTKTKKLKSRATHNHKLTKFHEQLKRIEREQYIEIKESKKHVLITSK